MVQPGFGGALDTPRTNVGDATYLSRAPDFADISQEASFRSPGKDGNLLQQLRNGRSHGISLRTPRQRGPLSDRQNLPPSVGGAEFTPLLKSATRNAINLQGKENPGRGQYSPGLGGMEEDGDLTPVARIDTSIYPGSHNRSYMDRTLPQADGSSVASTPLALPRRRGGDGGPLDDGNQLSLREQENVIDRIEKENFGLKLKIHFLEDALRKAGPGFSEAALKENTELKVDKVTMQRELHRCKKHLTSAERDLESYRRQMLELQEKAKRKHVDDSQREEMDNLRQTLEQREAEIERLQRQVDLEADAQGQIEKLKDDIGDLEADVRDKERLLSDRDDELEALQDKLDEAEENLKDAERQALELKQGSAQNDELEEAKEALQDLEAELRDRERRLDERDGDLEESKAKIRDLEAEIRAKDRSLNEIDSDLKEAAATVAELEAALGEKGRVLVERDRELEDLRDNLNRAEEAAKHAERKLLALEQDGHYRESLQEAQNIAQILKIDLREKDRLLAERDGELEDLKDKLDAAEMKVRSVERQRTSGEEDRAIRAELDEARDAVRDLKSGLREKDRLLSQRDSELEDLKDRLEAADAKIKSAERKMVAAEDDRGVRGELDEARTTIRELKADLRDKDRLLTEQDGKLEDWKDKVNEQERKRQEMERKLRAAETNQGDLEDLAGAKRTTQDLEQKIGQLETRLSETKGLLREAVREREQAEADLEELHDEMANKSVVTKGLSRQVEEKTARLQRELDKSTRDYTALAQDLSEANRKKASLEAEVRELRQRQAAFDEEQENVQVQIEEVENELLAMADEKDMLQSRHDELVRESASQQGTITRLQAEVDRLEQDGREQRELLDALAMSEASLRRKVERARSECAAYRMRAEKQQRDMSQLRKPPGPRGTGSDEAIETLVRAAEGAEDRHRREIKGMVVQMEWMQSRWEREAALRADAAYAKKFIQLQLDVAKAWYVFFPPGAPPPPPFFLFSCSPSSEPQTLRWPPLVQQQSAAPRTRAHPHQPPWLPQAPRCPAIFGSCLVPPPWCQALVACLPPCRALHRPGAHLGPHLGWTGGPEGKAGRCES